MILASVSWPVDSGWSTFGRLVFTFLHLSQGVSLGAPEGTLNVHSELEYTVPEAKRSIWTGLLPIEGKIAAYMCDGCGRVLLYGQPRQEA